MKNILKTIKYYFIFLGIKNCKICGSRTRSAKIGKTLFGKNREREYTCAEQFCSNHRNWLSRKKWNTVNKTR